VRLRRCALQQAIARLVCGCVSTTVLACGGGTLDAGSNRAPERLPVGPQNPVILANDGPYDNWHGEYALLLAQAGAPTLAGIVVSAGGAWFDLEANFSGWQELVTRARESGLLNVPDPIRSTSQPLQRPGDGNIDSTVPNDSEGARFIIEASSRLGRPDLPLVVATGGRLTDLADAYLLDPTVTDRVVVVASLGTGFSADEQVAQMGAPNGEMDAWADAIVVQRFRYVQVSAYYDHLNDLPAERIAELPDNSFGEWMRAKQPQILSIPEAADQVSVIAVGLPAFTLDVTRVSQSGWNGAQPTLAPDENGQAWLVTASDGAAARERLWQLLALTEAKSRSP
jgi:hypothetical protein